MTQIHTTLPLAPPAASLILHDYRRCPFCIRTRIVLHLKGIAYQRVEEPIRQWTHWMRTHVNSPRVPVLRAIDSNHDDLWHMPESNAINEYLDKHFGAPLFTPADSTTYQTMTQWWQWCDTELKPHIDHYKYGENRQYQASKVKYHAQKLGEVLQVLESALEKQTHLIDNTLTLADIAIIPFIRQIQRTRNGEFSFSSYPRILTWSNQLLATDWFNDRVMKKVT